MKVLGIASPFGHDPAAALLIDGRIIAAAEEERFTRQKHAEGQYPVNAVNYCLSAAGLQPCQIDYVAYPWSYAFLREKRWEYFRQAFRQRPSKAYKKCFRGYKEFEGNKTFLNGTLAACGFDVGSIPVEWVEHQVAHAASTFCFSGFEKAAVLSIDAGGEITSVLLGRMTEDDLVKIKEILITDSLGNFYSTMTDYLGFRRGDGEYKVMGMAPYGVSSRINFDHIVWWNDRERTYHCHPDYVWATRDRRYDVSKMFSRQMVKEFGPPREGDVLSEPYTHIAAVTQKKLEDMVLRLVDTYLRDVLEECGHLCLAGGVALNVAMNRKLTELPYVREVWVQPAAHDAGTALGAAAYVARKCGDTIEPMRHAYYGPSCTEEEIRRELAQWPFPFVKENNIAERVAELIKSGIVVGWFQGRMEWGPRALGNRSILGNPATPGTADKINAIIKFRERWRPFCPSVLAGHAEEVFGTDHPAPFMTIAFKVSAAWKDRIPEVVHVDGTCRPQVVDRDSNPKFHGLMERFYQKTGVPVLINTSLNRRGEPMVCSPRDAMAMFEGSGLEYLAIGDFLVTKKDASQG